MGQFEPLPLIKGVTNNADEIQKLKIQNLKSKNFILYEDKITKSNKDSL